MTFEQLFAFRQLGGEYDYRNIEWLACDLKNGAITLDITTLPTERVAVSQFSGRGHEHQLICAKAATWLIDTGHSWSCAPKDLHYNGGVADVCALDAELFVECGVTRAEKVLRGIGGNCNILVCPYAEDGYPGYLFKRGDPSLQLSYEVHHTAAARAAIALLSNAQQKRLDEKK